MLQSASISVVMYRSASFCVIPGHSTVCQSKANTTQNSSIENGSEKTSHVGFPNFGTPNYGINATSNGELSVIIGCWNWVKRNSCRDEQTLSSSAIEVVLMFFRVRSQRRFNKWAAANVDVRMDDGFCSEFWEKEPSILRRVGKQRGKKLCLMIWRRDKTVLIFKGSRRNSETCLVTGTSARQAIS